GHPSHKSLLSISKMASQAADQRPNDTVAEIISACLLGNKDKALVPIGSDKVIAPGGKITYTQSSVSLENLIGQMMFSAPGGKKEEGAGEAPKPPGGAAPAPGGAAPAPAAPARQ